jgi:hypothetical protein
MLSATDPRVDAPQVVAKAVAVAEAVGHSPLPLGDHHGPQ